MSAYECWCEQKQRLHASLAQTESLSGATYLVRHALAQVEQSVLAAQTDDMLRQQAGVLFSCCKSAVGLMDASITQKVWVAQSAQKPQKRALPVWLLLIAAAMELAVGLYGYFKGETVLWILAAGGLAVGLAGCLLLGRQPRRALTTQDDVRVSLHPDADRLLQQVDGLMQSLDRYLIDFAYLNEAAGAKSSQPDSQTIGWMADLLEAISDCDEEARQPAMDAAERMLQGMGVEARAYAPKDRALFTQLPSKTETRTLTPALLSIETGRLLRLGVAAVQQTESVQPTENRQSTRLDQAPASDAMQPTADAAPLADERQLDNGEKSVREARPEDKPLDAPVEP